MTYQDEDYEDLTNSSETNANSSRVDFANDDYDLFIFAQNWPDTNCIEWKERDSNNTCNLRENQVLQ